MKKITFSKRVVSMVLCIAILMTYIPVTVFGAESGNRHYQRIADASTMNNWTKYFDLNNLTTKNAGGVWTDKSVFTDASAFLGTGITMQDADKNFLTALSAIAANKEVVGYHTVPTDTVLILDLSNSMADHEAEQDLIDAANDAIRTLLGNNNNNRVGVVLYSGDNASTSSYSGAVTRILDIARYSTTDSEGRYLNLSSSGRVSVNSNVTGGSNLNRAKSFNGATYMQAGLWEAWKMFEEIPDSDTVIGPNNWQSGEARMPIVVLMSDGDPSQATSNYNNVGSSNVGNGQSSNMPAGQGFLVQLTASYIKNRIENKYNVHGENGAGRSLFYTLGFEVSNYSVAQSILNPDGSTITDELWKDYAALTTGSLNVRVKSRTGSSTTVAIQKDSYVTDKHYVDGYFPATTNGLKQVFAKLVDEIVLQSRYYPTHLEGGSPDFSGYVEFTDILGAYMEVKQVNGILLGDTLFDGHMMASKLAETGAGGLGTPENPTALGDEFIRAVKSRLGIVNTADAQQLIAKAYADGQLRYNSATDWSNYIMWYAKADGTYAGFYDKDGTESVPEGAVYINRSYGFLGETTGSIKNSDMMYMSVQVRTNIETGMQTVSWKIPAALVPMVTYLVTLTGTSVDQATDVSLTVEDRTVQPIRLVYETGLRSDLNEFNITRITDQNHLAADGHTRMFWNNYFANLSSESHDDHITTMAEFKPNKENERFYFTFDSAVFKEGANGYEIVGNESLNVNGTYYHRRYIFEDGKDSPVFFYEQMSKASIQAAIDNGYQADFETLDKTRTGAWVVPKGTPARELQMYDEPKADKTNPTKSATMVFHPYLSEQNNIVAVDMNLGNNGLLMVTPATGIKISKTVDIFETGTSDTFKFRVTASASGSYDTWITDINDTPSGNPGTATFTNGVYEVSLKKDQTVWISGLPAGTSYAVEEISDNADYKIKSVHVNNVSTGKLATGTVAQYLVDDVRFVNTPIGEGDLVITKQVVDSQGNPVDVNSNVHFTARVELKDSDNQALSGTFQSSKGQITLVNGAYTITLAEGESFIIRGIPEETKYTVTEINIPAGFALDSTRSQLSGIIEGVNQALIVNTYAPVGTNGQNIDVNISKVITGNRSEWLSGEAYTFNLVRLANNQVIGTEIITASDVVKGHMWNLAGETFTRAGNYYYEIREVVGNQGGITYDAAARRFCVTVADEDMDGDLEVILVSNELNTTVSGTWQVAAQFSNVYMPTGTASAIIQIQKEMSGNHGLNGYQFVLYDQDPRNSSEYSEIVRSGLTDAAGRTTIELYYTASDVGEIYTYYLAEVNHGLKINNIQYSDQVYTVVVKVIDNLDGTVSAQVEIQGLTAGGTIPTFTNTYVPSTSDFITLSGKKEIEGDRVLNLNEFEFVIEAETVGAPMPATTTVKNGANGFFSFPAIEFGDSHKGNTYVYKIYEVEDAMAKIGGFQYDKTVYTVTVTVTDNGESITATAAISNGTQSVDNMVFTNTYDAKDAEVILTGTKLLEGKTLQADEFEFVIEAETVGAPMPANATAKNDSKGNITFDKITFSKAGTYVYRLTEKNGGIANYDYDESVYTVTVTVTDNSQGLLYARVALAKNDVASEEIVFNNGFTPTAITYDIHADFGGEKVLEGRRLKDGEFEFALMNARTGEIIGETVWNALDGKFEFQDVTLMAAGIHHFKIVEIAGDEKGVTYDNTSFYVRLEVVQSDAGVLSITDKQLHKGIVTVEEVGGVPTEVTEYTNITDGGIIQFVNVYKADATEIVIEGLKTLTGRTLEEGEFSFELYENGKLVETVVHDGDGKFAFEAISADRAGEYVYTVREVQGDAEGITYDTAVYVVKVQLTDNEDGTFKVDYTYLKGTEEVDGIVFTNVYTKPEIPVTGEESDLQLWLVLLLVSGGCFAGATVYTKKKQEAEE